MNVQSDWTWEQVDALLFFYLFFFVCDANANFWFLIVIQAMREIINDKRYNALKTLGERKQAFNEVRNKLHMRIPCTILKLVFKFSSIN